MSKYCWLVFFLGLGNLCFSQTTEGESYLAGVYQGKSLFIQNPFNKEDRSFCIDRILVNDKEVDINVNYSALMIDFEGFELNTPVRVKIINKDPECNPIIINPESILFHTIFRFSSVYLSDTAMVWSTKGERGIGSFDIQRLSGGIWIDEATIEAKGVYDKSEYNFYPRLEDGPNKYRVKYNFPKGSRIGHLYSWEVEYDYYPQPVEFNPKRVLRYLYFSRYTPYEIYDMGANLITSGEGKEADLSKVRMRRGQYVIYFGGKYPGTFYRE